VAGVNCTSANPSPRFERHNEGQDEDSFGISRSCSVVISVADSLTTFAPPTRELESSGASITRKSCWNRASRSKAASLFAVSRGNAGILQGLIKAIERHVPRADERSPNDVIREITDSPLPELALVPTPLPLLPRSERDQGAPTFA
jgi:hypothetical protein